MIADEPSAMNFFIMIIVHFHLHRTIKIVPDYYICLHAIVVSDRTATVVSVSVRG